MKRASRHRAGLRWWTKNGEPFLARVCWRLPPWGHHWPYPKRDNAPDSVEFFLIAHCVKPAWDRFFPSTNATLRRPQTGNRNSVVSLGKKDIKSQISDLKRSDVI
jgi:hypothetical protein